MCVEATVKVISIFSLNYLLVKKKKVGVFSNFEVLQMQLIVFSSDIYI